MSRPPTAAGLSRVSYDSYVMVGKERRFLQEKNRDCQENCFEEEERTSISSSKARNGSATDQACAGHPRGACGGSASKISDTCPRHASSKRRSIPWRNSRACFLTFGDRPFVLIHAVTKGPS